jgi:predicted short-subunit dehydrogenase-like oxidoreductase (DUF2520 family)
MRRTGERLKQHVLYPHSHLDDILRIHSCPCTLYPVPCTLLYMRISIIGAGRVGQAIGRRAREAGYEIADVVCRSRRAATAAVRFIGAGQTQSAARASLSAADLVLISTPDDKISDAVELIQRNASNIGRAAVIHTSGALSSRLLDPLVVHGMAVASCHPLQTFQSPGRALRLIPGSYFCIEGQPRAVRAARRLVLDIGARHFTIATEMKSLYHAAAVMASGGVTSLTSISFEMLVRCGLSEADSKKVLLPLIEGTIANLRAVGAARALTGPVSRGDTGTIERNMKAIAAVDHDWLELYRLLASRSIKLIEQRSFDRKLISAMKRLLDRH